MGFMRRNGSTHEGHGHTCETTSGCSSANNLNPISMPTIVVYKSARDIKEVDSVLYNIERSFLFLREYEMTLQGPMVHLSTKKCCVNVAAA